MRPFWQNEYLLFLIWCFFLWDVTVCKRRVKFLIKHFEVCQKFDMLKVSCDHEVTSILNLFASAFLNKGDGNSG